MAAPRRIRFGISTPPVYKTYGDLREIWQAADELGWDTAFTSDHFVPIFPGGAKGANWIEDACLEGWTALAALGAVTKRLRIGCLVTSNTYRHPAVLAKMGATVDCITNGRLEFGIGAGWNEVEHWMYGIPFYTEQERLERLAEAVQVIRKLWTEHRANFAGQYYQLTEALCEPKPVQLPHPPILLGGNDAAVSLPVVAEYADAYHAMGAPEVLERKLAALRAVCDDVGRDFDEIEKVAAMILVVRDSAADASRRADERANELGIRPEIARSLFAAGTPDDVAARIQRYLDLGVTHILFSGFQNDINMLEVFAREVMPRFR